MSMQTTKLLGWTFSQWAIAAGRLGRGEPTLFGANRLRKEWLNKNPCHPGESGLMLAVVQPMDWNYAADLFALPPPALYANGLS